MDQVKGCGDITFICQHIYNKGKDQLCNNTFVLCVLPFHAEELNMHPSACVYIHRLLGVAYLISARPLVAFLFCTEHQSDHLKISSARNTCSLLSSHLHTKRNSIHRVQVELLINIRWDTFIAWNMLCLLPVVRQQTRGWKKKRRTKECKLKTHSKSNVNSMHALRCKKEERTAARP